jgi:hypothetical protein
VLTSSQWGDFSFVGSGNDAVDERINAEFSLNHHYREKKKGEKERRKRKEKEKRKEKKEKRKEKKEEKERRKRKKKKKEEKERRKRKEKKKGEKRKEERKKGGSTYEQLNSFFQADHVQTTIYFVLAVREINK